MKSSARWKVLQISTLTLGLWKYTYHEEFTSPDHLSLEYRSVKVSMSQSRCAGQTPIFELYDPKARQTLCLMESLRQVECATDSHTHLGALE